MANIIDRRLNGKHKSAVNRQRFIRRFKNQIKQALNKAINKRSITDIESGESIDIPSKDIKEPIIRHGHGGKNESVHPGNIDYNTGDIIPRPPVPNGQSSGPHASPDSIFGEDEFTFEISRKNF